MIGKNKKKKIKRASTRAAQQMANGFNIGISEYINQLNDQYDALAEAIMAGQHGEYNIRPVVRGNVWRLGRIRENG